AAGANLDYVRFFNHVEMPGSRRRADLGDLSILAKYFGKDAGLVIADPFHSWVPSAVDTRSQRDLRNWLDRLTEELDARQITVLCLRHLSKDATKLALYRGGGFIDIVAAARVALIVGPHP